MKSKRENRTRNNRRIKSRNKSRIRSRNNKRIRLRNKRIRSMNKKYLILKQLKGGANDYFNKLPDEVITSILIGSDREIMAMLIGREEDNPRWDDFMNAGQANRKFNKIFNNILNDKDPLTKKLMALDRKDIIKLKMTNWFDFGGQSKTEDEKNMRKKILDKVIIARKISISMENVWIEWKGANKQQDAPDLNEVIEDGDQPPNQTHITFEELQVGNRYKIMSANHQTGPVIRDYEAKIISVEVDPITVDNFIFKVVFETTVVMIPQSAHAPRRISLDAPRTYEMKIDYRIPDSQFAYSMGTTQGGWFIMDNLYEYPVMFKKLN